MFHSLSVSENTSFNRSTNADDKLLLSVIFTGNNYAVSLALLHFHQFLNLEVEASSHWDFCSSCYPVALQDSLQNMHAKAPNAMLAQESRMMDKSVTLKMILMRGMFLGHIYSCKSLFMAIMISRGQLSSLLSIQHVYY